MFSLMEHLRAAPPTVHPGIKIVIIVIDLINRISPGVHSDREFWTTGVNVPVGPESKPNWLALWCARAHMQSAQLCYTGRESKI